MPTGSYLTALIKAKQARLNRSSICSILLALDIEYSCRQMTSRELVTSCVFSNLLTADDCQRFGHDGRICFLATILFKMMTSRELVTSRVFSILLTADDCQRFGHDGRICLSHTIILISSMLGSTPT